jgi:protein gp37
MQKTKIDWADSVCNPVCGCTYNCPFCYARRMNARFGWVEDFSKPQFFPDRLKQLYSKKPQVIFMDSMSDIADWHPEWLEAVYKAMADNPQHKYLFLTKRPEKYVGMLKGFSQSIMLNWWFGQSLPTARKNNYGWAVPHHFLSIEPLLLAPETYFNLFGTGWVIIGAETGNRKEKVIPKREWISDIVCQCRSSNVPVFLKSSLTDIWGEPLIQEFPW